MRDLEKLVKLLQELEDQLVVCMRCGMCQAVCPLYAETRREADVARGKLALLEGLAHRMFKDPRGVAERLDRCLLCGSCAANCPSGVKVLDIFIKARIILATYMGLSPLKKLIFRGIIAHPQIFNHLAKWMARLQWFFIKEANRALGTSCIRFPLSLLANRHIMPLAYRPFHEKVPYLDSEPGASGLKVALFVGCLIDKIFPSVAEATIDALRYHGVGIFIPEEQACCGMPAVSSGDLKTFQSLVRYNLEIFRKESFDVLVTSCATCAATIKEIWPLLFETGDQDLKQWVHEISDKTMDIHQFLVHKVGVREATPQVSPSVKTVTYHDPCHLRKSLGVFSEPRKCIMANPKVSLKEMEEPERCCGLGGSFGLEHYELSHRIGTRKLEKIVATGCDIVATACPACMIQLSDMLSQANIPVSVRHSIEIYAESCKR